VSTRAKRYLDKAKECERMAAKAIKPLQVASLTRDAQLWIDLARQAEHWESVRDMMAENRGRNQIDHYLPPPHA